MTNLSDRKLVHELCEIKDGLNEWESDFIKQMAKRVLYQFQDLTPGMREKSEAILKGKGNA